MKLYHYTTWQGEEVARTGTLAPSNDYGWGIDTVLTDWPKLVFLTPSPRWERSVQAASLEMHHEKCGSCPETYTQLGIPCWRFEVDVEPESIKPALDIRLINLVHWEEMLIDALKLGADVTKWWVSREAHPIGKAYKYKEGDWQLQGEGGMSEMGGGELWETY